jgi:hypothetical protein
MWNEWNGVAIVRGNEIVNTPLPILRIRLWPSSETRGRHMLNVVRPYSLWDIWRSEILSIRHVILGWKLVFSHICFYFLLRLMKKLNFKIWNKKLSWFWSYVVVAWFYYTLLATLLLVLCHSNFSLQ